MNPNNPGPPQQPNANNVQRRRILPGPIRIIHGIVPQRRANIIANQPQGGGGNGDVGEARPADIATRKNRFAEGFERRRKIREISQQTAARQKKWREEMAPVLLIECFSSLFNDARLSDITLRVGSRLFHAHKLVLSAWSETFRSLTGDRWAAGSGRVDPQEVTLTETAECQEVFEDFLRFMYTEQVELTKDNVYPILTLADKYLVRDLCDVCEEYLLMMLDSTATLWADATKALERTGGFPKVQERSISLLENNFHRGIPNDTNRDLLIRLLQSSNLVVPKEMFVFEVIIQWLKERDGSLEAEDSVVQLLSLVRFEHIVTADLSKLWHHHDYLPPLQLWLKEKVFDAVTSRALAAEEAYANIQQDFAPPRVYMEPLFCVHVHNRPRSSTGYLALRCLRLFTDAKDFKTLKLSCPVARQSPERNIYAISKNMWEVGGLAVQQDMEDKWNVKFIIRPHFDDIGRSYSVAILSHKTGAEDEQLQMPPITCVDRGDVGREMTIKIPRTSLEHDQKPDRLWVHVAIYVYGEDKSLK